MVYIKAKKKETVTDGMDRVGQCLYTTSMGGMDWNDDTLHLHVSLSIYLPTFEEVEEKKELKMEAAEMAGEE